MALSRRTFGLWTVGDRSGADHHLAVEGAGAAAEEVVDADGVAGVGPRPLGEDRAEVIVADPDQVAADEEVIAGTFLEVIGAGASDQDVAADAASERVDAVAPEQEVVARSAVQDVVSVAPRGPAGGSRA